MDSTDMQTNAPDNTDQGQDPIPVMAGTPHIAINFCGALSAILNGKKVTRIEWEDTQVYGFMEGETLVIHNGIKKDNQTHQWILVRGDIEAKDWMILREDQ